MNSGDDRVNGPNDSACPRRMAPSSGAATPTMDIVPNADMDNASATSPVTANPVEAVSRTNQSEDVAPSADSSFGFTSTCPPSPRHVNTAPAALLHSLVGDQSATDDSGLEKDAAGAVKVVSLARNVVTCPSADVRCASAGVTASFPSSDTVRSHPSNNHRSTPRWW